jgi:hypothetical protein
MASSDSFSPPTLSSGNRSSSNPHFAWQRDYEAVLTTADTDALFKLVEIAQAAILTRRAELEGSPDHHSERQAIEEALANLRVVKRDRLKFL